MSFKILYVEDNTAYAKSVEKALSPKPADTEKGADPRAAESRPLVIKVIQKPEQLPQELKANYDLLLADLLFPDGAGDEKNRLDDIIRFAQEWSEANKLERPLPIIAYTRREKGALDYCLQRRDALFDIWDKASASPPYAAWRLTRLAVEVARMRPDALLERLIRTMEGGASWHHHVREMARRYSNGWTEADQIGQAGHCILDIASDLKVSSACKTYWKVMSDWEPLGRAVSQRTRGHARHVINVFWLGYLLMHDKGCRPWFEQVWKKLLTDRRDMGCVVTEDPIEALSDCWFYASLFHDSANCVEKQDSVPKKAKEVLAGFGDFIDLKPGKGVVLDTLEQCADALFHDLKADISSRLKPLWEKSLKEGHPDHGVVAGAHVVRTIQEKENPQQHCFVREAARAMAIHNLVGQLPGTPGAFLSWDKEPIACLLLLCDQIQTWDRERGDKKLSEKDEPERAELLDLKVTKKNDHTQISMAIEYVAPRHLDHAPEIFTRVKDALEEIIEEKPKAALSRIERPWPFSVSVKCWLSGKPLTRKMEF